ncbi:RRBP1 protein, partial [Columbina picui]|nr:RRBP1 protein [Columbina picui]
MDVYDPQTLGVMVFGGFMVISAIGIFLVSTFSMKETSYEEALAKQRKELEKSQQQKIEKKKKEKPVEKKGKAKKKEEKPNGKIPEQQLTQEVTDSPKDVVLEPTVVPEPVTVESPVTGVSVATQEKEKPAPSPKEKRKKEKKVAKVEPAPSPVLASPPVSVSKGSPVLEVTPKEVPVVAILPVGTQQSAPVVSSTTIKKIDTLLTHEEQKHEGPVKKKAASKKKSEPAPADSDGPLYLPYKTLVSTVSSMVFSEGEAQQLIEILSEKAGIVQDTWHMVGLPAPLWLSNTRALPSLGRCGGDRKWHVFGKAGPELSAERAKAVAVEGKLKEQLLTREREIAAVQARMQASYQDHISETQQLQGKIRTLQEQLENGPNMQLARLQQENSILRDALNQATSQMESKQNAELAKLRQECNKLMKELRLAVPTQAEASSWGVAAAAGIQLSQRWGAPAWTGQCWESPNLFALTLLCFSSLPPKELQARLLSSEAEVKNKLLELDNVKGKLQDASSENMKLLERIKSTEALLEAGQMREAEKDRHLQTFDESDGLLPVFLSRGFEILCSVNKQLDGLQHMWLIALCVWSRQDLREKNWKTMEVLTMVEKACDEKLLAVTKEKEELAQQLDVLQTQTKQVLLSALPGITVASHQDYNMWLQEFKEKTMDMLKQQTVTTKPLDSVLKLKEAEEVQSTLQAECEQYRAILAETEGMLRDLQKSVEEEEQVWKAKLMVSEEELQKSQLQLKSLEEIVEKLKADLQSTDQVRLFGCRSRYAFLSQRGPKPSCINELFFLSVPPQQLRQLLSQSQEQLEAAKMETQKQSKELALVRGNPQSCPAGTSLWDLTALPGADLHIQLQGQHPPCGLGEGRKAQPLKTQLEQNETLVEKEQVLRQKLALELEEAQSSACSLQAELEKLRLAENAAASNVEEAQHLK